MSKAMILFASGEFAEVDAALVEQFRPPTFKAYQVAVNMGRARRKGRPYEGGDQNRGEDGYFHSPERAIILTYKSALDLQQGDEVLVPVANHNHPRVGIVIASSSDYTGDLREIYGLSVDEKDVAGFPPTTFAKIGDKLVFVGIG